MTVRGGHKSRARVVHAGFAALALLAAGTVLGQGAVQDPAFDFCVTETEDFTARAGCIEEFRHAHRGIYEYGVANGFYHEESGFDAARFLGTFWDWRVLVGLPPKHPFPRCMSLAPTFGPADYREIWACIKRLDPDAAIRDAI